MAKEWRYVNCDCCAGIMWGGEYPTECPTCNGTGIEGWILPSGHMFRYPGGPAMGSWPDGYKDAIDPESSGTSTALAKGGG